MVVSSELEKVTFSISVSGMQAIAHTCGKESDEIEAEIALNIQQSLANKGIKLNLSDVQIEIHSIGKID